MRNLQPIHTVAGDRAKTGQTTYLDRLALVDFNYVETEAVYSFSRCYKDRLQREKITHVY